MVTPSWHRRMLTVLRSRRPIEKAQIEAVDSKNQNNSPLLFRLPLEIRLHIFSLVFQGREATMHVHPILQGSRMSYHECEYLSELPYALHGHHGHQDEADVLFEGQKNGKGPLHLLLTCRQM